MQDSVPRDTPSQVCVTPFDRAKYAVGSAAGVGGVAAVIGLGSGSIVLAVAAGIGAAVFSPEIRGVLVDHLPAPQGASSRGAKWRWLLTGEVEQGDEEPEDQPEASREDDAMEALQPRPHLTPTLQVDRVATPPGRSLRTPSSSFFTFSDVLRRGFVPSLDRIYLATLEDGTDVFVSSTQLCHVALAGATRGGKGHIKRSLMAQLAYAGAELYLLDPNYTRWDRESVDPTGRLCPEDWTPYDRFLQNDPTELIPVRKKYQVIGTYLQAANVELDRRLERYGNSMPVGRPIFIFLDELPDIVDNIPDVQVILKKLLRQGAKVGVNVVCLSQDFLVKTLFPQSGGGAVRDCYRTVLYVGGDATTANVLLDMPAREVPENELGKGRVMLRCDVVRPAAKARSPYVDNEALYRLLGPSTYTPPTDEDDSQPSAYLLSPQTRLVAPEPPRPPEPRTATQQPTLMRPPAGTANQRRREQLRRLHRTSEWGEQRQGAQENGLTADDRAVLAAYQGGKKSGGAINAATGIPLNRINISLHRLAGRSLIDWYPRK